MRPRRPPEPFRRLSTLTLAAALATGGAAWVTPARAQTVEPCTPYRVPAPGALLGRFRVRNRAPTARRALVKVSIPFARGVWPRGVDGPVPVLVDGTIAGELIPIKWHHQRCSPGAGGRHSAAIAQLRVPMTLAAGEDRVHEVRLSAGPLPLFRTPENLDIWLANGLLSTLQVRVHAGGKVYTAAPLTPANLKIVDLSALSFTARFRERFRDTGGKALRGLGMALYLTVDSGQDHGTLVFTVGNDVMEEPVSGGLRFDRLEVRFPTYFHFRLTEPGAYGNPPRATAGGWTTVTLLGKPDHLGDGQSLAFRGTWGIHLPSDAVRARDFAADAGHPLLPVATFDDWKRSGAAGTLGYLPAPRFPTIAAGRAALAPLCTRAIAGTPYSHLGYINRRPPDTGAQPDFAANLPLFYLQAVQTQSPCPIRPALVAADREVLRPSFWWETRGGVEDRIRPQGATTGGVFWSGRPHYDPSWNRGPQFDHWNARSWKRGFKVATRPAAPGKNWEGIDNQHSAFATLLAIDELTRDPFIHDLLRYYQGVVHWNDLSAGWKGRVGAERASRLARDAVQLMKADDRAPSAALLRAGIVAKNRAYLAAARANLAASGGRVTAIGTHNADDLRIPFCKGLTAAQCKARYGGKRAILAWQTGFTMEFEELMVETGLDAATARKVMDLYLDTGRYAFCSTLPRKSWIPPCGPPGSPESYILLKDPADRHAGGFFKHWWAGWLRVMARRTGNRNHLFFKNTVLPYFKKSVFAWPPPARQRKNLYWDDRDPWRTMDL